MNLVILQYDSSAETAGMMAMGAGMIIFWIILYLFFAFCLYKIFQKANYQQPIAAFVPVWNVFAMADIVKKQWWWGLLLCIPYVNFIALIFIYLRLAKFFGKSDGFAVGLILLSFIFLPILAFGDDQYNPNALPDERQQ